VMRLAPLYLPWRREWLERLERLERLDRLDDADLLRLECEEWLECDKRLVDAFVVLVRLALVLLLDADDALRHRRHINTATSTRTPLIVTTYGRQQPVAFQAALSSHNRRAKSNGFGLYPFAISLRYGGGVYGADHGTQPCRARTCSRPRSAAWRSTRA
jgi:hypothetical protein